jgi:hypothetical protein
VPIGTKVPSYGVVSAIRFDGVERMYMMVDAHGSVSLMPEDVVRGRLPSPAVSDHEGR